MKVKNRHKLTTVQGEEEWRAILEEHDLELISLKTAIPATMDHLVMRCRRCGQQEDVLQSNLRRRTYLCRSCRDQGRFQYSLENIKALLLRHGGKYISGEYKDRDSVLTIRCPRCGKKVDKRAQDIVRTPVGCDLCRHDAIVATVLGRNDNISTARALAEARGGRCLSPGPVVRAADRLAWECSLGHRWEAQLSSVKNLGTWCPYCRTSVGENMVRILLEGAFGKPFPRQFPAFLGGMELDGYCAELALAFEHHGVQHYRHVLRFQKSREEFQRQQERDERKERLCREHSIALLVIPHEVTDKGLKETREWLSDALDRLGVSPPKDLCTVEVDEGKIYDATRDPRHQEFLDVLGRRGGGFPRGDFRGRNRKLTITCREGHRWNTTAALVVKGHWCPTCAGLARKTMEEIRADLGQKGWSLSGEVEYRNAHRLLPMRCPGGHLHRRTWNSWQQGSQSCGQCRREEEFKRFQTKMKSRGITIQADPTGTLSGNRLPQGTCHQCGAVSVLSVEKWKSTTSCQGCGNQLSHPYHTCLTRIRSNARDTQRKNGERQ